ncbi:hypothetical protein BJV82DRAFT_138374 [Fennellomyces sp. T-0311]|nr:hypothetical protein BJV82DRAFT_138374 [Fennellomyces sp. T-0311]
MHSRGALITLTLAMLAIIAGVLATEAGFTDYIMVFREPVTDQTYKQARSDVKYAGGEVTREYRAALKGLAVSLPDGQVDTLEQKSYVDYMEESGEVHTMSGGA